MPLPCFLRHSFGGSICVRFFFRLRLSKMLGGIGSIAALVFTPISVFACALFLPMSVFAARGEPVPIRIADELISVLIGSGDGGLYELLSDVAIDTGRLPRSFEVDPDHFARSFCGALDGGENLDNADRPYSIMLEHAAPDVGPLMSLFDVLEGAAISDLDIYVRGDILGFILCTSFQTSP